MWRYAERYNGRMPTFIDESGDTGPTARGGKPYFRLAAVWVPTLDHAEAFRQAVRQLRRDLGLRVSYEFRFARMHSYPERRRAFFETALASPFRFTACSIDKTAPYWNGADSQEQHWATATTLAVHLRGEYQRTEEQVSHRLREAIVVDDTSDVAFLDAVKTAFRGLRSAKYTAEPLVSQAFFRDSHAEELLQLADMVCGAVGAWFNGDRTWYVMIRERDLGTLCLP